jgi:hypothetical protein
MKEVRCIDNFGTNAMKYLMLNLLLLLSSLVNAQQTIFFESFENSFTWNIINSGNNANHWEWGQQAGNGYSFPGSHSMYIANNIGVYSYDNSIGVPETTVVYTTVNTLGKTAPITIGWDYKGAGDGVNDVMKLVFTRNNSWPLNLWGASTSLQSYPGFYHTDITFPANGYLNNCIFYIGFMFVCDNNAVTPPSFAFDNLQVSIQQSPLSLDTTQAPTQQQHFVRDNPIEAIYNLNGQQVTDTTKGIFIIQRKYSKNKIIK